MRFPSPYCSLCSSSCVAYALFHTYPSIFYCSRCISELHLRCPSIIPLPQGLSLPEDTEDLTSQQRTAMSLIKLLQQKKHSFIEMEKDLNRLFRAYVERVFEELGTLSNTFADATWKLDFLIAKAEELYFTARIPGYKLVCEESKQMAQITTDQDLNSLLQEYGCYLSPQAINLRISEMLSKKPFLDELGPEREAEICILTNDRLLIQSPEDLSVRTKQSFPAGFGPVSLGSAFVQLLDRSHVLLTGGDNSPNCFMLRLSDTKSQCEAVSLHPMIVPHSFHGLVQYSQSSAFVFGGKRHGLPISSCEKISLEGRIAENCWEQIAEMHSPRYCFNPCVCNHCIYCAGGFTGSVEMYSPEENHFQMMSFSIPHEPSAAFSLVFEEEIYILTPFATYIIQQNQQNQLQEEDRFTPRRRAEWSRTPVCVYEDRAYVVVGEDLRLYQMRRGREHDLDLNDFELQVYFGPGERAIDNK